jgi:predicted phosphoribosyltransferase
MATRVFNDRSEAGRALAALLDDYRDGDVVVLGLARGGVPVAFEVAQALGAPLEPFLVRKLGVPGQDELAMGAIASGGVVVLNEDLVRRLGIPRDEVDSTAHRQGAELLRLQRAYRGGDHPVTPIAGKTAILVDDGIATGSSMRAAVRAVREFGPERVVVAVPTAPADTCDALADTVDDVVCASTPSPFTAVGQSYMEFPQVTDDEVRAILAAA